MKFTYFSSRNGAARELPDDIVAAIRQYLLDEGVDMTWDRGDLQDCLLDFRWNGERLLMNQLAPIFNYVAIHGGVWDEEPQQYEDPYV